MQQFIIHAPIIIHNQSAKSHATFYNTCSNSNNPPKACSKTLVNMIQLILIQSKTKFQTWLKNGHFTNKYWKVSNKPLQLEQCKSKVAPRRIRLSLVENLVFNNLHTRISALTHWKNLITHNFALWRPFKLQVRHQNLTSHFARINSPKL